jgi:6-phosphogluconate dehydrogenase (decarboxylating)
MVHNGIGAHAGLRQASVLERFGFGLDLHDRRNLEVRSVVRSAARNSHAAFSVEGGKSKIRGYVEDSGEERWTIEGDRRGRPSR